jgi:DNA-binding beta-propeller fold protein YncE
MTKLGRPAVMRGLPLLVVLGGALIVACSGDEPTPDNTKPTPPPPSLSINPAANAPEFVSPFDATPDPKGENVYFTAIATDTGAPAVFTAPAGGGAVRKIAEGGPIVAPFGIAISDDGQTLFIADSGVDHGEDERKGAVLRLGVGGGTATIVGGSEKLEPRGLEIDKGTLYFSGRGADGKAGVFKVPAGGGAISVVHSGEPLSAPSGVAMSSDGTLFVADSSSDNGAAVYSIKSGGAPELVKGEIGLGYPAGLALTMDSSTLLISGRVPGEGKDVVYRVRIADKTTTLITDVVGNFEEAAGLHRAKGADVFAWADRFANNSGTVFVLK